MSSDRRRLNLSLSMQSPQQREAWKVLRAIPLGQRTDAVCRMVCRAQEQEALLDAVRKAIREELEKFHIEQRIKETERPQAESILGFLRALQEGDDTA